jgi:DNA-binding CsgD family transcriptional regulator
MSRDLRFELGIGICLLHKAGAQLGLRSFSHAHRNLAAFKRTSISREDPFYRLEGLTLEARIRGSQGDLEGALAVEADLPGGFAPPRALGHLLGVLSMIYAASGDPDRARWYAAHARRNGTNIEMACTARLGELIADGVEFHHDAFCSSAADVVVGSSKAGYLDGLVLAYRVYSPIVEAAACDPQAAYILRGLLAKSRDYELARSASLEIRADDPAEPLALLTRRELEVLNLLAIGMTNPEIAERLFIARSTAKVHVRHIFEKLGVRNRLQAMIRAQELLGSDAP